MEARSDIVPPTTTHLQTIFLYIRIIKHKMMHILLIVGTIIGLASGHANAVDYDVRAMVPADPPTQAPQISDPIDGFQSGGSALGLSGTCQVMSPAVVVSIWRSGAPIGSTSCTGAGTFFLSIGLTHGVNVLVPRSSSITGQFGPDGTPISVTYAVPVQPAESPVSPPTNSSEQAADSGSTAPMPTNLYVESQQPFYYYANDGLVTLRLVIRNGDAPYKLVVDWGDGVIEARTYEQPGLITLRHYYKKPSTYAVRAKITDVKGVTTTITLTTVTFSQSIEPPEPTITTASMRQIWLYTVGLLVLGSAMLLYLYEHHFAGSRRTERR